MDAHGMAIAPGGKNIKLSLGDNHYMAKDLAELNLGRALAIGYIPHCQIILTNPLEAVHVFK